MQNVVSAILALGIGSQKFLISLDRDAAVAIDIAAAKLQIEMVPVAIVCDRGQHPRFYLDPFHSPAPLIHSRSSTNPNRTVLPTEGYSTQPLTHASRKLTGDSTPRRLFREVLALTKMNFNNADFADGDPITVRFARRIGEILSYMNEGDENRHYRFYM